MAKKIMQQGGTKITRIQVLNLQQVPGFGEGWGLVLVLFGWVGLTL